MITCITYTYLAEGIVGGHIYHISTGGKIVGDHVERHLTREHQLETSNTGIVDMRLLPSLMGNRD